MKIPQGGNLSSPQTTLVILLGASEWPKFTELTSSKAFAHSANALKTYLLNKDQFGLPRENLLNLFDTDKSASDIDEYISDFLDQHMADMHALGKDATDVLVYFIGHGVFDATGSDYSLAVRRTRQENPSGSGLRIVSLAHTLKEKARRLRRMIILDSCFSGVAVRAFQGAPAQAAIQQTIAAFAVPGTVRGIPGRGTALLCSSGSTIPSVIARDGSHTMFTYALLKAAKAGVPRNQKQLSLREIHDLTTDTLRNAPEEKAPNPELHSPDQSEGDVANIPFFPNIISLGTLLCSYQEHISAVRSVAWSPDGRLLASASSDNTVQVWDATTGHNLLKYREHSDTVWDVAWSSDSDRLASASGDGTIQVWNAKTGQKIFLLAQHDTWMQDVTWSPDGKYLASGGGNVVQLWDAVDGHNISTYRTSTALTSVVWSPDSTRLAPATAQGAVQIWDAATGRNLLTFNGNFDKIWAFVAWSPDGKYLASSGQDGIVQIWNTITGKHVLSYQGHSGPVYGITWSPDGKYVASASRDQTAQVWNAKTGRTQFVYNHSGWVATVAWSPDKRYVASAGEDSRVDVWKAF